MTKYGCFFERHRPQTVTVYPFLLVHLSGRNNITAITLTLSYTYQHTNASKNRRIGHHIITAAKSVNLFIPILVLYHLLMYLCFLYSCGISILQIHIFTGQHVNVYRKTGTTFDNVHTYPPMVHSKPGINGRLWYWLYVHRYRAVVYTARQATSGGLTSISVLSLFN